jgi:hypothetical protein
MAVNVLFLAEVSLALLVAKKAAEGERLIIVQQLGTAWKKVLIMGKIGGKACVVR